MLLKHGTPAKEPIMNIKILRKAINVVYLNYYGNNISNLCVDRIINYYKQFTKDARRESNSKNKGAKAGKG